MKIVCDAICYYGVPRIVTTGTAGADVGGLSEDIDELPLTLISELGS